MPRFLRRLLSLFLAVYLWVVTPSPAYAWEIWVVTNHQRILKIQNVTTAPTLVFVVQHDPVPQSYQDSLGDMAFAPNGRLYGISLTLGSPAQLYTVDLATGHLTPVGSLPFEWGNALYFDWNTQRAFVGGGLESWQPYRLLNGLYAFDNYDPAHAFLWHDMRPDWPRGGFTAGYTQTHGYLYVGWGQGHMYAHTTYLLQVVTDANQHFVRYTNLGAAEASGVPEGFYALVSDGETLYAVSPHSLYRVTIQNGTASFTKVMDFALQPGEIVLGASVPRTDLALSGTASASALTPGQSLTLKFTVHNQGPFAADQIRVQVRLPQGLALQQVTVSTGTYQPNTGEWQTGPLAAGDTATLTLEVSTQALGVHTVQAEIVASSLLDPDSRPEQGFDVDDYQDGRPDDDEVTLIIDVLSVALPLTGFPQGRITPVEQRPREGPEPTDLVLAIPSLGIWAPIVGVPPSATGWDLSWLGDQVGWLQGSAFPTWSGNTVLTGHVWNADNTPGIFYRLRQLRFGDRVYLLAGGHTYIYMVQDNRLLRPDQNAEAWVHLEQDWVTLITCEGYLPEAGTYRYRRMVRAVRIGEGESLCLPSTQGCPFK